MSYTQRALLLKAAASLEADYDYVDTVTAERAAEQIQRAEA